MNRVALLALLISFAGFSQMKLHYNNSGGVYDSENNTINPNQVRLLMKENAKALQLYNAGRNKKTFGNVMFYGGIGLAGINLYQGIMDANADTGPELAIIGGLMFVASIPVKLGYSKKVKAAVEEYNKGIPSVPEQRVSLTVLGNANGVGVRIQF